MLNWLQNYLGGMINPGNPQAGGGFWNSLGGATGRSSAMGGGPAGLAGAFSPSMFQQFQQAAGQNKPTTFAGPNSQQPIQSDAALAVGQPGAGLKL